MGRRIQRIWIFIAMTIAMTMALPQDSLASSRVQTLVNNIGTGTRPLIEYHDPIDYAEKYSKSFGGMTELFLVNWNLSSLVLTKNDKWQKEDEQALLSILLDDTIVNSYIKVRPEKFIKAANTAISDITKLIDNELLKNVKTIGKADKWMTTVLRDSMKIQLQRSQAKMDMLAIIAANTDDPNLKKACENCINTVFTNTFNTLKTSVVNRLVAMGVEKAEALAVVKNQILMTPMRQMFKEAIYVLGECAKGVSYALIILDVKDLLTYVTGVQNKTSAYMSIVSYQEIYNATLTAYEKAIKQYKNGDSDQEAIIEALFQMMLDSRKKAYVSLQKMLGKSEWNKELNRNDAFRLRNSKIENITITNYEKITVPDASIKLNCLSCNMYVNETKKIKATVNGLNSDVTWKTDDSSVAKVDSKGKITAKKKGTATISATANGKTASCKVIVINPSIELNKSSATIYMTETKTLQLKATVKGLDSKVKWTSSNNSVATVDSNGKVTAKKTGAVTITAKANGVTAKCKVTVEKATLSFAAMYRQFLSTSGVRYYCILELGNSKKPVLLTTNTLYDPRRSGRPTANECSVYTVENNRVLYLGRLTCRASFCIMYDKNYLYSLRIRYIEQYHIVGDTMKYKIVSYDFYDDIKNVNFKKNEFVRR